MKEVVLLGHVCTGHDAYPPRPNIQASENFFIKGRGVHRQGDAWGVHCRTIPPFDCHSSIMGRPSSSFFANGKIVALKGDPVVCGSFTAEGEPSAIFG
jgi:uncharacterized Zn-binding protein involved in type VI secretion